jgi:hypothetical protein
MNPLVGEEGEAAVSGESLLVSASVDDDPVWRMTCCMAAEWSWTGRFTIACSLCCCLWVR